MPMPKRYLPQHLVWLFEAIPLPTLHSAVLHGFLAITLAAKCALINAKVLNNSQDLHRFSVRDSHIIHVHCSPHRENKQNLDARICNHSLPAPATNLLCSHPPPLLHLTPSDHSLLPLSGCVQIQWLFAYICVQPAMRSLKGRSTTKSTFKRNKIGFYRRIDRPVNALTQ